MDIRKRWTKEEELKLYHLHKSFNGTEVKENKFEELARELGRTHQATSRHYYHMLKYDVFSILDIEQETTNKSATKTSVVLQVKNQSKDESLITSKNNQYEVFWTPKRLKILKDAIRERINENHTYKRMIHLLMDKFSLSNTTIENKIRDLQNEVGIQDWKELADKIEQGKVKSNLKNRVYRKKKSKRKFVILSKPKATKQEIVKQEIVKQEPIQSIEETKPLVEEVKQVEVKQEVAQTEKPLVVEVKKQSLFSVLKNAYLNYKIAKMEKKLANLKNQVQ